MNHNLILIFVMGVISTFIGWITNVVAIKLLFRPHKAYKIPLFGWTIQGLIPKRQLDIAYALGDVISTEFITGNDVLESISREDIKAQLRAKIEKYVRNQILLRMPFLLPESIQAYFADLLAKTIGQELDKFLDNPRMFFQEEEMKQIKDEINKIVVKKVKSLELVELENLVYSLARSELKHIEILGGVLGFIIGIAQGIISVIWNL